MSRNATSSNQSELEFGFSALKQELEDLREILELVACSRIEHLLPTFIETAYHTTATFRRLVQTMREVQELIEIPETLLQRRRLSDLQSIKYHALILDKDRSGIGKTDEMNARERQCEAIKKEIGSLEVDIAAASSEAFDKLAPNVRPKLEEKLVKLKRRLVAQNGELRHAVTCRVLAERAARRGEED